MSFAKKAAHFCSANSKIITMVFFLFVSLGSTKTKYIQHISFLEIFGTKERFFFFFLTTPDLNDKFSFSHQDR